MDLRPRVDLFDEPFRDRLERRFRALARDRLRLGQNVVLEFGFRGRAERDELCEMARALGASVELRHLAVPFDELLRRLGVRNRQGTSAVITPELLAGYARVFEAPDDELGLFDRR